MKKLKRDHESTTPLLEDAAVQISRLCRRNKLLLEVQTRPLPPPPAPPSPPRPTVVTHDSLYWHQTATTLLTENTQLREGLGNKTQECTELSANLARMARAHAELEKQYAASCRELLILEADRITPAAPKPPIPHIPTSTQGKDAIYWHQACRSIQAQYFDLKSELDSKTDQFLRLTAKHAKLTAPEPQAEYPRGRESHSSQDTPTTAIDCENAAP